MPIVTDGLIGYWHYQQGVIGSTWENIAPATKGQYNGIINGAVVQSNGMYFDGIDDYIYIDSLNPLSDSITLDIIFSVDNNRGQMGLVTGFKDGNNQFSAEIRSFIPKDSIFYNFTNGTYVNTTTNDVYNYNTIYKSSYTYNKTVGMYKTYIDGVLKTTTNASTPGFNNDYKISIGSGYYNSPQLYFSGKIISVKVYNKALTELEVTQNYNTGIEIGLDGGGEPPIQNPPVPTITHQSRSRLSRVTSIDRSIVKFTFDQDVAEWRVRTMGTDHETGILADSGGAVNSGTEISAEVDYAELYQEGQNRVNIYGKNASGDWTPYSN